MRGSICIAAGLLVTNLVLVHESPTARTAKIEPRPSARSAFVEPSATIQNENDRLRWFWQARNNGLHMTSCHHEDPLAILDADVEPTPGREHLIGNRQFGVMMFDEQGTLLAYMEPVGCGSLYAGDQSLSLHFSDRLTIRVREQYDQGSALMVHIVERDGDLLRERLRTELDLRSESATHEREVEGSVRYLDHDRIEIIHHGRQRTIPAGAWEAVDDHCTWDLATRTSSCRIRAGARTPGSE
jgi:hypothetical protein